MRGEISYNPDLRAYVFRGAIANIRRLFISEDLGQLFRLVQMEMTRPANG